MNEQDTRPLRRDPATGRFVPGTGGGPGRPKRPDLLVLARDKSKWPPEEAAVMAWNTLCDLAAKGDLHAARAVLARLCGAEETAAQVALQVNQQQLVEAGAMAGPQPPDTTSELARQLAKASSITMDAVSKVRRSSKGWNEAMGDFSRAAARVSTVTRQAERVPIDQHPQPTSDPTPDQE